MAYFLFDLQGPDGHVIQQIECEIEFTGHLCRIDGFSFEIDSIRALEFDGDGVELYEESPCEHVATLAKWVKAQAKSCPVFDETAYGQYRADNPKEVAAHQKAAA